MIFIYLSLIFPFIDAVSNSNFYFIPFLAFDLVSPVNEKNYMSIIYELNLLS